MPFRALPLVSDILRQNGLFPLCWQDCQNDQQDGTDIQVKHCTGYSCLI